MKVIIYQFDADMFDRDDVEGYSREECESRYAEDEFVQRFDSEDANALQELFNNTDSVYGLNIDNAFFRVFYE